MLWHTSIHAFMYLRECFKLNLFIYMYRNSGVDAGYFGKGGSNKYIHTIGGGGALFSV